MLAKIGVKMSKLHSYTAAGEMPWKLIQNKNAIIQGHINPIHIQLIPTNRCNGNCSWCSCSKVDRTLELGIKEIREIIEEFALLGAQAITITGGGEPTIHPDFMNILVACGRFGYKIGMVTNGVMIPKGKFEYDLLNQLLTWLRISVYDPEGDYDTSLIEKIALLLPEVDIGISFTVTDKVNIKIAQAVCDLAAITPNITHIRFVEDILHANEEYLLQAMAMVEKACRDLTTKAIYQYRNIFTRGTEQCLISLLKPLINADGYVYPCCGVQYATSELRTMPEQFRMCKWHEFKYQKAFDGSICRKCYYTKYNDVLSNLIADLDHKEFV